MSDSAAMGDPVQRPQAAQPPVCSAPNGGGFPIGTRIRGGPATYEAGGGYRNWSLKLANTTPGSCGNIHPVVVIVDKERELRPRHIQLEFHDGTRWRPVGIERTDRDENVGVFDDGFPGFTVKAGKTRTVKVRLSFTSEARSERAVVSAAVVQRRADDGDWVGESDDYPFGIENTENTEDVENAEGLGDTGGTGGAGGTGDVGAESESDGGRDGSDGGGGSSGGGGGLERSDGGGSSYADELAATGPRALLGVSAVAGILFAGGWGLFVGARRLRAAARRR
ncbi:cell wall protein [Streptomyces sp. NPDC056486]|uniref:cell wall protein n=1 Tax=Streptomyces sp. NPDC056486 TaxID=3345835 RepID=UPI00367F443A